MQKGGKKTKRTEKLFQANDFIIDCNALFQFEASLLLNSPKMKNQESCSSMTRSKGKVSLQENDLGAQGYFCKNTVFRMGREFTLIVA